MWDCGMCGCIGVAASLTWCPNCGVPKEEPVSVVVHQTSAPEPGKPVKAAPTRPEPAIVPEPPDEPEAA